MLEPGNQYFAVNKCHNHRIICGDFALIYQHPDWPDFPELATGQHTRKWKWRDWQRIIKPTADKAAGNLRAALMFEKKRPAALR